MSKDAPKSSPGPWRWGEHLADRLFCAALDHDHGRPMAVGVIREPLLSEADATLISHAPDMADMLRELELDDGGKCPICYRNCDMMEDYVHAPECRLGRLLEAIGR